MLSVKGKRLSADIAAYVPVVDQALRAFSSDVSYAVGMVRQATTIQSKREVWAIRSELRDAESSARKLCAQDGAGCLLQTPCGVGQCRFAQGDLAEITVPESGLVAGKPKPGGGVGYEVDSAIAALRAHRRIKDGC